MPRTLPCCSLPVSLSHSLALPLAGIQAPEIAMSPSEAEFSEESTMGEAAVIQDSRRRMCPCTGSALHTELGPSTEVGTGPPGGLFCPLVTPQECGVLLSNPLGPGSLDSASLRCTSQSPACSSPCWRALRPLPGDSSLSPASAELILPVCSQGWRD